MSPAPLDLPALVLELEILEARADASPFVRCFRTVWAVFEAPRGLGAPEDLVDGRFLPAAASAVAGALMARFTEPPMSKSPSRSTRVFLFCMPPLDPALEAELADLAPLPAWALGPRGGAIVQQEGLLWYLFCVLFKTLD